MPATEWHEVLNWNAQSRYFIVSTCMSGQHIKQKSCTKTCLKAYGPTATIKRDERSVRANRWCRKLSSLVGCCELRVGRHELRWTLHLNTLREERHAKRFMKLECEYTILDGKIKVQFKVGKCAWDEPNYVQLNVQPVPRSKHTPSQLHKPVS